jgi:CBS domain-containing protein
MKETCEKIMTTKPMSCAPSDSLTRAAERMREANIGALPVLEGEDGWLVGIVTDRDLVTRALARGLEPDATRVSDVMTRDVATCLPGDPIEKAVERMEERHVRRLPIVDDDGRLLGIIAQADLATRVHDRALVTEFLEEVSEPVRLGAP